MVGVESNVAVRERLREVDAVTSSERECDRECQGVRDFGIDGVGVSSKVKDGEADSDVVLVPETDNESEMLIRAVALMAE